MLAALNELTAKGFFINSTWQPCIWLASPPPFPPRAPPPPKKEHNFKQKLNGITRVDWEGGSVLQALLPDFPCAPPPCAWRVGELIAESFISWGVHVLIFDHGFPTVH